MKKKILNIYNDYKVEFLKYKNIFIKKIQKIIKNVLLYYALLKEKILIKEHRKKYLSLFGIILIINLVVINTYISFGYYYNQDSFSIIRSKVGNMYLKKYDYTLLVYLENVDNTGNGNGKYHLGDEIPTLGYKYSGYKCENNSVLIYDDKTKTTSVTINQKEACSIYFDVIGSTDITISIMLEENIGSNTYSVSERIPAFGYKYSYYECTNNVKLDYNSELHSIKLSTSTKEHCHIYFKKVTADISLKLYVEENHLKEDYIERMSIPSNVSYKLNSSKSMCVNNNNERLDTLVSYEDGFINIESSEIINCSIYLDRENE